MNVAPSEGPTSNASDVSSLLRPPEDCPPVIYKFMRFDRIEDYDPPLKACQEHYRPLLEQGMVYLAHPSSFNDPYDCQIRFDFSPDDPQRMRAYFRRMLLHMRQKLGVIEFENLIDEKCRDVRFNRTPEFFTGLRALDILSNRVGVCCFAGTKSSILLWSHYTGKHSGFCVGLRTKPLWEGVTQPRDNPTTIPLQVVYAEKYPRLSAFRFDDLDVTLDFLRTKSTEWEYEKEVRIVRANASSAGRSLCLLDYVAEVVVGSRIGEERLKEVKAALRNLGRNTPLFQAEPSNTEFHLTFRELTY